MRTLILTLVLLVQPAHARLDDDVFKPTPTTAAATSTPTTDTANSIWGWMSQTVDQWADKIEKAGYVQVSDKIRETKDAWLGPKQTQEQREVLREERVRNREVKKVVEEMPTYVTPDKGTSAETLKQTSETLTKQNKFMPDQAKVEVFSGKLTDAKGIKRIPKMALKPEQKLQPLNFKLPEIKIGQAQYKELKPLPFVTTYKSADFEKWQKFASTFKEPVYSEPNREEFGLERLITAESVKSALKDLKLVEKTVEEKPYTPWNQDDVRNLQAQMLFEQKDKCHLVVGLLRDLAAKGTHLDEANFRLGVCMHKMGFYNESVHRLLKVIRSGDPEYVSESVETLLTDVPASADREVAQALLTLKNQDLIPEKVRDAAWYVIAKGLAKMQDWDKSLFYAKRVSDQSPKKPQALFVQSVAEYSTGKVEESIQTLERTRNMIAKSGTDDPQLKSLVSINRARLYFQKKDYENANLEYLKIDKSHPLWVQALTEQAWSQLLMGDSAGSIGNMYSLHSPFFTHVYKPESYAVRTMGYLNICQYGDAYQTLNLMETTYRGWQSKLDEFINDKSRSAYATVKTYLRSKSDVDTNGLPHQVIREMARQRNFLNLQNEVNRLEDEKAQYAFIDGLIKTDIDKMTARKTAATQRIAEFKAKIKEAQTKKELMIHVNEWTAKIKLDQEFIRTHDQWLEVFKFSREGFKLVKSEAIARLEKNKTQMMAEADKTLHKNLVGMRTQLAKLIDNNELLRYEIFSGSGENIRYQTAGGKVQGENRVPAYIKPTKTLAWSFTGEYWADEIGHYRSQLKNNCPETKEMNTGYKGPKTAKTY